VPNDFDDAPKTDADARPVDLTDLAVAEDLAVSGPPDSALEAVPRDKTPTKRRCRECGGHVEVDGGWHPPVDADAAWAFAVSCGMACTATRADAEKPWSFCPKKGVAWVRDSRINYERRKLVAPAWDGKERRRG